MNTFSGVINEIISNRDLTIIKVQVNESVFEVLAIGSNSTEPEYKNGDIVQLLFKETEVILGKGNQVNSILNQVSGEVTAVQLGQLLSKINLKTDIGPLVAIIPSSSVDILKLQNGDRVVAMIKTTEMMISL